MAIGSGPGPLGCQGTNRRRRTYASLVGGLSLVPEIADDLQITEPTVSEHLKALEEYGLAPPIYRAWVLGTTVPPTR